MFSRTAKAVLLKSLEIISEFIRKPTEDERDIRGTVQGGKHYVNVWTITLILFLLQSFRGCGDLLLFLRLVRNFSRPKI